MGWIHTGGGYYENEETRERIRGKANLPSDGSSVKPTGNGKLPCMSCHKMTAHTQRPADSSEWSIHVCSVCGGKTRVSLK